MGMTLGFFYMKITFEKEMFLLNVVIIDLYRHSQKKKQCGKEN